MNRQILRSVLLFIFGLVLSFFFLWLALNGVNIQSVKHIILSVDFKVLFICFLLLCGCVFLRSYRWRLIAHRPVTEHRHFFRATSLGLFGNMIFPARAGDFARIFIISKILKLKLSCALVSSLIDRLMDIFMLILSSILIFYFTPAGAILGQWLALTLIFVLLITLFLLLYFISQGQIFAPLRRLLASWLRNWPVNINVFLNELRNEFKSIVLYRMKIKIFTLMFVILIFDYFAIFFLLYSFHNDVPLEAPLVLWVFLSVGATLPSAPGYIGIYQIAAVWALSIFHIDNSVAVVVATTLQIVTLIVAIVLSGTGAWSICRQSMKSHSTLAKSL